MIMKILSTILLTLLIVLGACTSPQVSPDPFVRVSNGRLTVNGKPYYYIGTNLAKRPPKEFFVNWII